jgi:phosphatidate cytidylyltransferase
MQATWNGLGARVGAGLVLAPLVLLAIYAGPPYSDLLIVAVGGIAAWEWARMCRRMRWDWIVNLAAAAVALALIAGMAGRYEVAGWLIAGGSVGLMAAAREGQADTACLGLGVAYVALGCLAFLWLRDDHPNGLAVVFWLLAVVWATDIGAYFAGHTIGGPKLAPSISPKKTWAGLAGGMVAAGIVGAVMAQIAGVTALRIVLVSMVLAVVAQLGDLLESGLKRRYGVKDSSRLIPGHGGLLDRIDGLLAVALVYGGATFILGIPR